MLFSATYCQTSLTHAGWGKIYPRHAFAWKFFAGPFEESVLLPPFSGVWHSLHVSIHEEINCCYCAGNECVWSVMSYCDNLVQMSLTLVSEDFRRHHNHYSCAAEVVKIWETLWFTHKP